MASPTRHACRAPGLTPLQYAGTLRAFFNPTVEAAMHETTTLVMPAAFAG
jgi:hypothetical protein